MLCIKLRCYCILITVMLLSTLSPSTSQQAETTFAGNLDRSGETHASSDGIRDDGSQMDMPIRHVVNETVVDDIVGADQVPHSNTRPKKKASKPLGSAQSVGYVPPLEEVDKEEKVEVVKIPKEKDVVKFIPTLPPRCVIGNHAPLHPTPVCDKPYCVMLVVLRTTAFFC